MYSGPVQISHGLGLWKHICILWAAFESHKKVKIGNGRNIWFWHDAWIGPTPLKIMYHDLYGFTNNAGSYAPQCSNGSSWCISFRRNCSDWEIPRMALSERLRECISQTQKLRILLWTTQKYGLSLLIFATRQRTMRETALQLAM